MRGKQYTQSCKNAMRVVDGESWVGSRCNSEQGEMSFGVVGVGGKGNAREGVAVLMNERIWMCVNEIGSINSRIMYVGLCIKREFWKGVNEVGRE